MSKFCEYETCLPVIRHERPFPFTRNENKSKIMSAKVSKQYNIQRAIWASRQHRQSRPRTATGHCGRLMLQLSAVIFSLRDCTTPRSQTQTTTQNCLTLKSVAFLIFTLHCAPVVVVVDSMTSTSCPMKHAKPSSFAVAWNVDIGELVSSRNDERTCRRA